MKMLSLLAAITLVATPAGADEVRPSEGPVDASFTWTAVNLANIPAPDGGTSILMRSYVVLTSNIGGPIDKLGGTCLLQGVQRDQDWQATGACAYEDADGDVLFDTIEERGENGKGIFDGGTGKFAGMSGDHTYTTTFYSSIAGGGAQGIGSKKGRWTQPQQAAEVSKSQ